MKKQTLQNILPILIKGFILFLMIGFYGMEFVIVFGISLELLQIYVFVMFVSFLAFGLTIFKKIRLISYIVFVISFGIFIYLYNTSPEIIEHHDIDECMDGGNVYDLYEHRCRTDCWRWTEENGCEKIEPEVE